MKTLTIDFTYHFNPILKLKGLSYKAILWAFCGDHIYKGDTFNLFEIDYHNGYYTNKQTCMIKKEFLIEVLKSLHQEIPFDKVKTISRYELTGEEIMELILQ
jgi:hypothetical protein